MRVYRWKKPELTVTLTSGGTLLPNTTYWIFGFFHSILGGYDTYYGGHSPHSVPQSFTTDDSNKSISVAWKTTGNITSFSDAGSGKTLVTSPLHCLGNLYGYTTGDTITIVSGTYAGSYQITWVDYDSFIIDTAFSVDETSTWRCEIVPNSGRSFKLWMDTINPTASDGTFAGDLNSAKRTSHTPYVIGYTSTPVAVSAPFSIGEDYASMPFLNNGGRDTKQDSSFLYLFETGLPAFIENGTTMPTLPEFNQLFVDSGLYPNCRASSFQYNSTGSLIYYGFMEAPNATGTYNRLAMYCDYGSFNCPNVIMADGSTLFGRAIGRNYCGFIAREHITTCPVRTQFDIVPSIYSSESFNIQKLLVSIIPNTVAQNYTKQDIVGGFSFYVNYPAKGSLTDSSFKNTYIYWVIRTPRAEDGYRVMRNCSITNNFTGQTDFVVYDYMNISDIHHFENIDTDRADNLKTCKMNANNSNPVDVIFWRKDKVYINTGITSSKLTITQGSDVYEFTGTDEIEFDVKEQLSYPRYNTGTDTILYDFNVKIEADGYITQEFTLRIAKQLAGLMISLTPNPAPVQFSIRRLLSRIFQSGKTVSSSELITEGAIEHEAILEEEAEITNNARATYRPSTGDILMEQETVPGVWEEAEIIAEGVELVRGSASIIDDPDPIYIDQSIIAKIHNSQSIKALVDDNENIKATIKSNQRLHATITDPEHITATVRTSQNIKATIT
jgi:hypothetical protein